MSKEVLYTIRIPLYVDGNMNAGTFIGLLKGLAKIANKPRFCLPDEQQNLKKFVEFQLYAPKQTVMNWQKQMSSYGIMVEVKK